MAAIEHSELSAPITKTVTLDGSKQQVQWPLNTRYVYFRFDAGNTTDRKYSLGVTGDQIQLNADEWYGVAVFHDVQTRHSMDGKKSWLYLEGDSGETVDIEYSVIGGR